MKTFWQTMKDATIVVGAILGIGLLSGKEITMFFDSKKDIVIFAVMLSLLLVTVRVFCKKNNICGITQLTQRLPLPQLIETTLLICSYIVVVTLLAGVESVCNTLIAQTKFPFCSLALAMLCTYLTLNGKKCLTTMSAISLTLAVIYIAQTSTQQSQSCFNLLTNNFNSLPITYALFCFATTLGTSTQLDTNGNSIVQGIVPSAVISTIIWLLFELSHTSTDNTLPLFIYQNEIAEKVVFGVTLLLSGATSIVASALPIVEKLTTMTKDKKFSATITMLSALALSELGVNNLMRYGYTIVAVIGGAVAILIVTAKTTEQN